MYFYFKYIKKKSEAHTKDQNYEDSNKMGSQLRWLERTPDKREVDGSIPFEPTNLSINLEKKHIEKYIDEIR